MPRTLILHIGLEKTGTTSLQHFCADHAALLRRHGLLYPTRNKAFGTYNHAPLAACYVSAREADFTMSGRHAPREAVVASLLRNLARHPCPTTLLSAEHFSSRFEPPEVRALCEDMRAFTVRVLVVVRNHRARFFSSYATHVLSGGELTLRDYGDQMLTAGKRDFRISQIVGYWQAVFGRDAIDLIDYDAQEDIVPTILCRYGITAEAIRPLRRYRDLKSLRPSAVETIRLANGLVAGLQPVGARSSYPAWLQRRYFQNLVVRRVAAAPADDEAWRLDADLLARFDALAAKDRAWLGDHHGFALSSSITALEVGEPRGPVVDATARRQAEALVASVTQHRWRLSQGLVLAATMAGR